MRRTVDGVRYERGVLPERAQALCRGDARLLCPAPLGCEVAYTPCQAQDLPPQTVLTGTIFVERQ